MDSLKKLVKTINPKREFPSDIAKKNKEEQKKAEKERQSSTCRMMKTSDLFSPDLSKNYERSNGISFSGSRWRSCQDLRTRDEHRKAIRDGLQLKVLSRTNQAVRQKVEDGSECFNQQIAIFVVADRKNVSVHNIFPLVYNPVREAAMKEYLIVFESENLPLIENDYQPRYDSAKSSVQRKRMQDSEDEYCHHLIIRSNATWERIKPISYGIKKKCEIFAPKSNQMFSSKAKVTTENVCKYEKAAETKLLIIHAAIEEELENQNLEIKDFVFTKCALLSQNDLIEVNFPHSKMRI
jgi:hypothetical protein